MCLRKHGQHNNDERNMVLLKNILLTLFERVAKGKELNWRLNKDFSSTSFSFCWAAQPGTLRAQLSARSSSHCLEPQQLTPNSKLTRTSCGTQLYNCLSPTCFSERRICTQFNPSTVKPQLSPDIFDRMQLLFTPVHFLFDSSAGSEVNMLQSCHNFCSKFHMWNFLHVRLHPPHTYILQNSPGQQ